MSRITTKRNSTNVNAVIPALDMKELKGVKTETVMLIQSVINRLSDYEDTGFEPEELVGYHASSKLDVGEKIWVLTSYHYSPTIIECRITKKSIHKRISVTVRGEYPNGTDYKATFTESSIGKVLFTTYKEAEQALNA